jgi:hypothetical protein
MKMSDVTACGRTLDPHYPTNLAIALLSIAVTLAAAAARLIGGTPITQSVAWGVGAGLSVFFAWSLSRELDPDNELSAFVGTGLVIVALLFFDLPSLTALLWLMLALRMVNRTTGLRARPLDSLAVLGLGGWLTWQGHWIAGLITAAAFLLDGLLSRPLRYHLFFSGLVFVATAVVAILRGNVPTWAGPAMPVAILSVCVATLFLFVIATSCHVRTVGDATGRLLNPRRVQAAQVLALLAALLFAWWDGASGMVAVLPLWAAMTGVGIFRLSILLPLHRR